MVDFRKKLKGMREGAVEPSRTRFGDEIDIGEVLRILMRLSNYGDRISERCGDTALEFVQGLQQRAEKYGDRLKISPKQWTWLQDIGQKVLR